MEVEFPSSDDDSIYQSDHEIVLNRPPISPVGRPIVGYAAKVLDEEMDVIEAEEMSSDEPESGSDASTEALSESLDPISDDDMVDVSNKDRMLTEDDVELAATKPDPTNVEVAGIVTPTTSEDLNTATNAVAAVDAAADAEDTGAETLEKHLKEPRLTDDLPIPSATLSQVEAEEFSSNSVEQPEDMEMELSSPTPPLPNAISNLLQEDDVEEVNKELPEVVPDSTDIRIAAETDTTSQSVPLPEPERDEDADEETEDERFVDAVEPASRATVLSGEEVLFEAKDGAEVDADDAPAAESASASAPAPASELAEGQPDSDSAKQLPDSPTAAATPAAVPMVSEEETPQPSEENTPAKSMDVESDTMPPSQPDVTATESKIETESTHEENLELDNTNTAADTAFDTTTPTPTPIEVESNTSPEQSDTEKYAVESDAKDSEDSVRSVEEEEPKVDAERTVDAEETIEKEDPVDSEAEAKFSDAPEDKEDPSGSSPEQEQSYSFASSLASFGASVFGFRSAANQKQKEEEIKEPEETKELDVESEKDEVERTKEQEESDSVEKPADDEITSRALPDNVATEDAADEATETLLESAAESNAEKDSALSQSTEVTDESTVDDMEEVTKETEDAETEKEVEAIKEMADPKEVLKSSEEVTEKDAINLTVAPATVELETNKSVFQDLDPKSPKLSSEVARQMELSNTSLDVPDVEDISDGKVSIDSKKLATLGDASRELESIDVSKPETDATANDSVDRAPEFPDMDEIQINKPSSEPDNNTATGVESSNKSLTVAEKAAKDEFGADAVVEDELSPKDAELPKGSKSPPTSPSKQGMPSTKSFKKSSGGFMFGMTSFYRAFRKSSKSKEKEPQEEPNMRDTIVTARRNDSDASHKSKTKEKKRKTFSGKEDRSMANSKEQDQSVSDLGNSSVRESIAASEGENYLEMRTPEEKAEEDRHLRLEETLKSQIATLRSARSGFVDLALLTPMTEKTLAAVEFEAKRILASVPEVEDKKETLSRQVELLEMTTEAELMAKEKTLVAAKIKVAEAKCELDKLRHELFILNREIQEPKRALAQQRLRLKVRREKATKELGAATESKETMQRNLEQRKAMLDTYRAEVSRLEKSVQDLEGEWS